MRAGLLRETLVFEELQTTKSPSGGVRREYVGVYSCRGHKKRQAFIKEADGLDALERFRGSSLVFQVRCHPAINESQRVAYEGRFYSIEMLDRQRDNTYLVTLIKLNT